MEYCRNDDVYEIARAFFTGLDIEGPVSVEVKKTYDGKYYMIEPTVGRTDYFLDALSSNGTNFPLCEYTIATGHDVPHAEAADKAVWFDTERDRTCFLRTWRSLFKNGRFRRPVFPFLRLNDFRPYISALRVAIPVVARSILRRVRRTRHAKPY